MTRIYLVRHAESSPSNDLPEPEWPLSQVGEQQALDLIPVLTNLNVTKLFSSPYPRAIDTIKPLSQELNLDIRTIDDFRERKLTNGMVDDFMSILSKAWGDFDFKLPGCESSHDCQGRFKSAFHKVLEDCQNETVAIASHGNAIGLFLNHLDSTFAFNNWKSMRNPDIFKIEAVGNSIKWVKSFNWNEI